MGKMENDQHSRVLMTCLKRKKETHFWSLCVNLSVLQFKKKKISPECMSLSEL